MCISGVWQLNLWVDRRTVEIEALVAQEDPLGFDVLIGVDAIKALGRLSISKSGEVHFLRKQTCIHDRSSLH